MHIKILGNAFEFHVFFFLCAWPNSKGNDFAILSSALVGKMNFLFGLRILGFLCVCVCVRA